MRKYAITLGLALVLAVSGGLGLAASDPTAPPTVAPQNLAVNPGEGQDVSVVVDALRETVRRLPDDHRSWALLARAYVEQARVTGDAALYDRADQAVRRSLQIKPEQNAAALAADASLAAAAHSFESALDKSDQALATDPYDPTALAIRVDALTELGRYPEQLTALRTADARQPGVPITARYVYAHELRGDLPAAASLLRRSASTVMGAERAHLLTMLADVERRRGRLAVTADLLDQVHVIQPDYLPAELSRARLDVAEGRLTEAVRRWERISEQAPHSENLVEVADLYAVLGGQQRAAREIDAVRSAFLGMDRQTLSVELDAVLFLADHGQQRVALAAARDAWQHARGVHVADTLAWALHRNGRHREALTFARQATRLGTADGLLWLHLGQIEAALGLTDQARRHLRHGLRLATGSSPWQSARASRVLNRLPG